MINLPTQPREITAQWLSEVLAEPVSAVRLVDANSGTTGRAVIEVDQPPGGSLPKRLFVKLPPTDEMQKAFVTATGMGRTEVLFYRDLSCEVPVRVPRCYYANCDEAGEQYIMLLEHLEDSACTFRNATTCFSKDYVREMMGSFAELHAAYWESPRFATDLSWLTPPVQHEIAPVLVEQALQTHGESMPTVFSEMGELYIAETDAIHRLWQRGSETLIHGDVHDANLFYDTSRPGFLDWAIASRAPGMRDVGYFLAGSLSAQEQRDWGREMFDYYRAQLLALNVDAPSEEELWQQYQWHAAYIWVGSTVTLAMGDAWQPVNYVLATLERIHSSMQELNSVEAIKAAL